jgi:hypothetical protein
MKEAYLSMLKLRADAIERGMLDLAIVYGWAAMRLGAELIHAGTPLPRS